MKAAIFTGAGRPLTIREIPKPEPREGELLVRVAACGICGSDLHATEEGVFLQEEGTILGHEFSGVVEQSADPAFPPGTRVTAVPVNPCGSCAQCREGYPMMCATNSITGLAKDFPGAYAEYITLPARYAVALPDAVSFDEGATVEPLAVGLHAVDNANIRIGDRVLVIGGGPIGQAVAAFARAAGAASVILSERAPARLKAGPLFGATGTIDAGQEQDVGAAFAALADGPPDVVFDCVGVPGIIQKCIGLVRARGTIVVVGVCMKEDTQIPFTAIMKELRLQYVLGYKENDFARVLAALAAGLVRPLPMITDRLTFETLPAAFEQLRRPSDQIKAMIFP
ncbi:(R,R)-butanediol dehydrogenase / meso-butanediol dehydrogenase / diacetyl reductase [Rhodobacter sp. 24-YEA-8]|nr:alcohol dehydrogenase catalytic domain-containing protein [Rhodobacter sp. 24-YEA-8]SED16623.1 (R,R)-butanediol dehydrogenase / meso-butanediol dehydrogenase / diacetyl reductase [Rhodobacter sp. 24-YEA-8]